MTSNANIIEVGLTAIDGEPRARDLDIADRLGFTRPRDIRKLIERNIAELSRFGTCATVARVRGRSLVADHNAAQMGQSVIKFPSPSKDGGPKDVH